jgi:two-component system sensor histidine kinase ChiS
VTALRILVVGGRPAAKVARRLEERGYVCVATAAAQAIPAADALQPDAVVLTGPWGPAPKVLAELRAQPLLRSIPFLADAPAGRPTRGLEVDGIARTSAALERKLVIALRARELVRKEELSRHRLEVLLEITRLACDSRDAEQLLVRTALRLKDVLPCEQVSVLIFDDGPPVQSRLLDPVTGNATSVDLALSPAMRNAVATRTAAESDATLVQPLADGDEVAGAFMLRRSSGAWSNDDRDFIAAVAGSVSRSVRNTRLYESLQGQRSALESAYIDRYRELNDANRRLKAADKLKDEVLALVSHDVRAPLNVLLGHGRLLLDSKDLNDEHRPSVETTVRMGKKILGLVESLLDKARTDGQPLQLERRVFDLALVCMETVEELQILAREHQVVLQAEVPMSVDVLGDELKLRQVLQNLITNALAHATGATRVLVRCTPMRGLDGSRVKVVVEDDGAGVAEDELPRMFDRFGRTGLGLTICRDFIGLHEGEIWAEKAVPKGTAFVFTLPLEQETPPERREGTDAPLVLIAEHDAQLSQLCQLSLRGQYRVELAKDGEEAVAKALLLLPDLVLVDLFLPKLDGLQTIKALSARPQTAKLPMMLIAGHKDLGEKVRALDVGAIDVLPRTFEPTELLNRVRTALSRSRPALTTQVQPGNDPTTGLFDQLGVVTRLEEEMSRSNRYDRPLTIAVLKPTIPPKERTAACAAIVRNELRTPDVLGHLGNGVLVVVLPETPLEPARGLTSRLCSLLEAQGVAYSVRLVELRGDQTAAAALELLLA